MGKQENSYKWQSVNSGLKTSTS
ncbi:hypothetical protein H1P_1720009 [Hyella patelloides LEGE 07179]|uniref:Uncharacterized protein n=1 Tax=Hyella patelloides LEGE 07179 TaxID=945734 RepID=A0A563VNM1_9CYAN|nr:hypothetical protein H1P_1720009 [Hyella patelloides LEGE 07179]